MSTNAGNTSIDEFSGNKSFIGKYFNQQSMESSTF